MALLLGIAFAGFITGYVAAHDFGSNTAASDGTPAHPCDTTIYSQCVANNGIHQIYYPIPPADSMYQPTHDAAAKIDSLVTDVTFRSVTDSSVADVLIFTGNWQDVGWWAYGSCWGDYDEGGVDPDHWCRPQAIRFNTGDPPEWDATLTGRRVVACHELGHTLGLRHSTTTTCMNYGETSGAYYTLNADQIGHLNGQY